MIDELDYLRSELQAYIEVLDDEITTSPNDNHPQHMHDLSKILDEVVLKIKPICEDFEKLEDDDAPLTKFLKAGGGLSAFKQTKGELDHIFDEIDTLVKKASSLKNIYRTQKEDKQNKILFILTLVTTVVIPGQFLTGLWGMNFQHMPELEIEWMYPWGFWALFILTTCLILGFFRYEKLL